jgi:hypothetical protein
MAADKTIEICGLNLAASPHPAGIYIDALRDASRFVVHARASDFAKISLPRRYERNENLFLGRISVWTDIDLKGKWIDISNNEELTPDLKKLISIPENARPNYRTFSYVFDLSKHQLWFESRTELDDRLGPVTARGIFSQLLSRERRGLDKPDIAITILPEDGTVRRILSLPRLRTLLIRVTSQNPDVSSPEARARVQKQLDDMKAQELEVQYKKRADAHRLTPTPEVRELAEVGSENGFVRGEATNDAGEKVVLSTDQRPKRILAKVSAGGSFVSRLLSVLFL